MRRRFFSVRRRWALRWHRTERMDKPIIHHATAGEGCAYGCLIVAGIWALIGVVILVLVSR